MAILGAKNAAGATAGVATPENLARDLGIPVDSASLLSPRPCTKDRHINGSTNVTPLGIPENSSGSIGSNVTPKSPASRNCSPVSPKSVLQLRNGETQIGLLSLKDKLFLDLILNHTGYQGLLKILKQ